VGVGAEWECEGAGEGGRGVAKGRERHEVRRAEGMVGGVH
jgi:hypothetical protein